MTLPVAWITHPDCLLHDMGKDHPECPQRLRAIDERLRVSGLWDFLTHHQAPLASQAALERVHDAAYVQRVLQADLSRGPLHVDPDTTQMSATAPAALRAAGAAVMAVNLVLEQKAGLAFCSVRPPGHHAERAQAMGFCFFNNVAIAAAEALAQGLERVAILDFDVHYGNGTADIFRDDPRVTLLSTYQDRLYPYWKSLPDSPHLVDVPLSPYSGSAAFRSAVTERWLPVLEQQRPQLLLVSAGFDAHMDDGMAELRLTTDDFRWLGMVVEQVALDCCEGRVIATLEGGYNLDALARSVEAFLGPFLGGLPT